MANAKTGKEGGAGPFQPGRSYDEVGPELGSLHEARHEGTGRAVLTLLPGERMDWQPEGPWRLRLSCEPENPAVTLEVEQAPASARMKELANILVLMTAAVEQAMGPSCHHGPYLPVSKDRGGLPQSVHP
ncbi:hypothetical protein [Archangium lipolyticum]|uniref:hypothetical protein n=1 Tax=Archangium lipolyticum TaxID=2970465 RepID=UPI00214A100C|nr:hypothetical protein [Archangium lipolyticum]